jgi:hypothetical protein
MWEAYLFQTTTGAIGPKINFASASWSISLNDIESLSIDLAKADLPAVDLKFWLAPWWAGVLYLYDGNPVFAGPIISRPTESFNTLRLDCKGIRAVLEHRFVHEEQTDWSLLSRAQVFYTGLTYQSIAQRIVKLVLQKPGGWLPISFPLPEVTTTLTDDTHQKTYSAYNLGSNNAHETLVNLSALTNGPDIMFLPRLIDANTLTFDMIHGSETDPHIPQLQTPIWDTTPINGEVPDLDIVVTGSYQSNRVYATGDGTNGGLLIAVATDSEPISKGFPLLESTESHPGVQKRPTLQSRADADIKANANYLLEIQLTVRADGEYRLGTFWPGHRVQLVTGGLLSLDDGTHNMRLLNISGTNDGNIRMSLQIER